MKRGTEVSIYFSIVFIFMELIGGIGSIKRDFRRLWVLVLQHVLQLLPLPQTFHLSIQIVVVQFFPSNNIFYLVVVSNIEFFSAFNNDEYAWEE